MRKTLFAVALALGFLMGAAVPVAADVPGHNGRVAFMRRDGNFHWQVWVATSDLTDQKQLTAEPADSGWPVWAPSGGRIAFDSSRADPDPNDDAPVNDIFAMRADGSGVVKLTDSVGFSADAAWSPDGTLIAFDADRGDPSAGQGIYVMSSTDGSGLRRVTTLPAGDEFDLAPRWSPDGRSIVFTRYRLRDRAAGVPPLEQSALFVVRPDGSGLRQITPFGLLAGDADWSPNSARIVFETNGDEVSNTPADVYVVRRDGSGLTNLTDNAGRNGDNLDFSSDPVWSPDGRLVLFLDGHDSPGSFREGIATMRPNGEDRHFISAVPGIEHQPDWEALPRRHST